MTDHNINLIPTQNNLHELDVETASNGGDFKRAVQSLLEQPYRLTQIGIFRGRQFCAVPECNQLITLDHCFNCGQTSGKMPTSMDFLPRLQARCDWTILSDVTRILLSHGITAEATLSALIWLNEKHVRPAFDSDELSSILIDSVETAACRLVATP